MSDAPIIITLEIFPADGKGKRKLIVSGAPQHEMPVVRTGLFAQRHDLLDEVWIALGTRKPQVVKVKATTEKKDGQADEDEKAEGAETTAATGETANEETVPEAESAESESETDQVEIIPPAEPEPTGDQLVATEPDAEQLPLIEGDD